MSSSLLITSEIIETLLGSLHELPASRRLPSFIQVGALNETRNNCSGGVMCQWSRRPRANM